MKKKRNTVIDPGVYITTYFAFTSIVTEQGLESFS